MAGNPRVLRQPGLPKVVEIVLRVVGARRSPPGSRDHGPSCAPVYASIQVHDTRHRLHLSRAEYWCYLPAMPTVPAPLTLAPNLPFKYVGGDPSIDLVNTVDWTSRGPGGRAADGLRPADALGRGRGADERAAGIAAACARRSNIRASPSARIATPSRCAGSCGRSSRHRARKVRRRVARARGAERGALGGAGPARARAASAGDGEGRSAPVELARRGRASGLRALARAARGGGSARVGRVGANPRVRRRGLRLDVRGPQPERPATLVPDGGLRDAGEVPPARATPQPSRRTCTPRPRGSERSTRRPVSRGTATRDTATPRPRRTGRRSAPSRARGPRRIRPPDPRTRSTSIGLRCAP